MSSVSARRHPNANANANKKKGTQNPKLKTTSSSTSSSLISSSSREATRSQSRLKTNPSTSKSTSTSSKTLQKTTTEPKKDIVLTEQKISSNRKIISYEPNKDTSVLFGTLPSSLFGQINDILDRSLVDGAGSLPFLPSSHQTVKFSLKSLTQFFQDPADPNHASSSSKDSHSNNNNNNNNNIEEEEEAGDFKLLKILRAAYAKNIDKAEAYAMRNIFSFEDLPRSKRIQLLNVVHNNVNIDELESALEHINKDANEKEQDNVITNISDMDENHNKNDTRSSTHTHTHTHLIPTSINDIPTSSDIEKVQNEIEHLRFILLEKKRKRNVLASQLREICNTAGTVQKANHSIQSSMASVVVNNNNNNSTNPNLDNENTNDISSGNNNNNNNNIQDVMSHVMMEKKVLEQLTRQGKDLAERLDQIKENHSNGNENNNNDDDELNELLLRNRQRRDQLSLEDHFIEMKRRLPDIGNSNNIEGALAMLRKKKAKKSV